MTARSGRTASRFVAGLWACTAVLGGAGLILTVMAWSDLRPVDAYLNLALPVAAVAYATLGALIIRRAGNRVGSALLGEALALALMCLTSAYAVVGVVTDPGALPAAKLVGTLSELIFIPTVMGIIYVLLIFPTGALPSARWRFVATALIAMTALSLVGFVVTPRQVALPAPGGISLSFLNPFAIRSLGRGISTLMLGTITSLTAASVLLFAVAAVALVVRYRTGGGVLRQQIKWVASVTVAWVMFQAALAMAQAAAGRDSPVTIIAGLASGLTALILIPVAITVAILRYRLYEIDYIINRALVYGALTAILGAAYVLIVTVAGTLLQGSDIVTAGATLAVAALFQPLRRRIQAFIDRCFYRRKYDAARTVELFSSRLRDEVDLDAMQAELVGVVQETMQPRSVSIWLRG